LSIEGRPVECTETERLGRDSLHALMVPPRTWRTGNRLATPGDPKDQRASLFAKAYP